MAFNKQQIRESYSKLDSSNQTFISSAETSELIENFIQETVKISENTRDNADSEILWAMLGLQSLDVAIGNIATKNNIDKNELENFKQLLTQSIFNKLNKKTETSATQKELDRNDEFNNQQTINLGEQITTNETSEQFEKRKSTVSVPDYSNYEQGKDPYREPIE